jgi:hypothetical protein
LKLLIVLQQQNFKHGRQHKFPKDISRAIISIRGGNKRTGNEMGRNAEKQQDRTTKTVLIFASHELMLENERRQQCELCCGALANEKIEIAIFRRHSEVKN